MGAPSEGEFPEDDDFLVADDLAKLAAKLEVAEPMRFGQLGNMTISYLWKKKGGSTRGKLRMGYTTKTSGALRHFSAVDAVIWLAADHLAGRNAREIEAWLYHEMLHLGWDEEGERVALMGHDFEGFAAEVERYGDVLPDAKAIAGAFRQLMMFDGEIEGEWEAV